LHHYEQIGLLIPEDRAESGYRLYGDAEIDRLSRVLYYRELGFPLDDIATMLADDGIPARQHLERQYRLLTDRLRRVEAMVAAVNREMEATMKGHTLTAEEKLEAFGDVDPDQYHDEAHERWGNTDAWTQSRQRTASYSKDDWVTIRQAMDSLSARFAAAMQAGVAADSVEAMDLAEEHRRGITRWFYDCPVDLHRGLGDMYVNDHRFTENIDATVPGLANYMRDAINANADRQEQAET
jgi:DNA-binding transcriptional MerR regulator